MGEITNIEWCDHSANIWWGCTEVTEGCDRCYAKVLDHRWGGKHWNKRGPRRMIKSFTEDLKGYQKKAAAAGVMKTVFVGSMLDIFEKPMSVVNIRGELQKLPRIGGPDYQITTGTLRKDFFDTIHHYPNLIFLLLTKRPGNIIKYVPPHWLDEPPPNVMYGTSPTDQASFDWMIKELMQIPGRKFLSMEPMLEPIDILKEYYVEDKNNEFTSIRCGACMDWIIVGGESGHGKRYFNPDWARNILKQCGDAGIPFFMKQIDKIQSIPEDLLIREFPIHKAV